MKIKILMCCAGLKFSFSAGETVDTDDATAKDLIQAGYAKAVGGRQVSPPADLPKEAKTDGKSDNAADGGAGNTGGVSGVDARATNQSGAGTNGKQPSKSGT